MSRRRRSGKMTPDEEYQEFLRELAGTAGLRIPDEPAIEGPYRIVARSELGSDRPPDPMAPSHGVGATLSEQQIYLIAVAMVAFLRQVAEPVNRTTLAPRDFISERGRYPVGHASAASAEPCPCEDEADEQISLLGAVARVPNGLARLLEAAWSCRFNRDGKNLIRLLVGQVE